MDKKLPKKGFAKTAFQVAALAVGLFTARMLLPADARPARAGVIEQAENRLAAGVTDPLNRHPLAGAALLVIGLVAGKGWGALRTMRLKDQMNGLRVSAEDQIKNLKIRNDVKDVRFARLQEELDVVEKRRAQAELRAARLDMDLDLMNGHVNAVLRENRELKAADEERRGRRPPGAWMTKPPPGGYRA